MSTKCYIHVDLDAFYASVEQFDNPEYKGKPVIVGGLPTERRGVVSTCSYEARAYGVHSAMPIVNAVKLCPHAIFLPGRMKRYQEISKEIMSIFSDFSPDVQQISIDEAFLDISGTERLFGKPVEVATMLKAKIYEQTGLTVSVGISSSKYIAKIASGMQKPDGLFIVENGREEQFMQQLPLKDIWGIGQKTLSRINKAGYYSTTDVKKASQAMLVSLFGSSTGEFLYNAVRGTLHTVFNELPKTRSISSEKTFTFDLTDRYAIETIIMELSWDVMYRLFTEKLTSKTVHVKIRYEDFTTVSIQETSITAISSADELFVRVKKLFEKKYENGRGIRLIGIAAQNIDTSSGPIQQELFENVDKKKITVEKAIIEIQKKNPKLTIKKARLLKSTLLFLCFFTVMLTCNKNIYSQENENIELAKPFEDAFISGEAPIAMFNLTPESNQVEFFAEGSWEAMFTNYISISSGQENTSGASFSFSPPIFIQKTDLTVWFLLQETWYFEANIADDFEESTVAAGYYGDGFLQHARVGNRHILFSQNYGVTDADRGIGSGSNQAPGIMAQWAGDDWTADAILRFDMTESLEKTWLGQSESTENIIQLSQWQKGARFIFPEDSVQFVYSVYVESYNTNNTLYTDADGTSYKKLTPSEYMIVPSKNMLVLDSPTDANVLVTFSDNIPNIGTFNPRQGFLGQVQSWFGDDIILDNFAPSISNFYTNIDGKEALILQEKNFFSPFVDASLYNLSAFSQIHAASIVSQSSGVSDKNYGATIIDSSSLELPGFGSTDYFDEKNTYIQAFNQDGIVADTQSQFPFANNHPYVYLTPESSMHYTLEQSDTIITVQSLTTSSVLDIGTEAIAGSITVYRNGIKESLYSYDTKTGLISLSSPPGTFDTIRITWRENNETANTGALTVAGGFNKTITPNFEFNISSSVLWPVMEADSFADSTYDATGSINIALDAEYTKDNFVVENTLLSSFQTPNTSDTYRIDGMNDKQIETGYLSSNADIELPDNFTPIINSRPSSNEEILLGEKNSSTSSTIRDSERGEYIVHTDWEISSNTGWVAQNIELTSNASHLASAESFSIWIKQENTPQDYEIFLQLGVSSEENNVIEKQNEIPTWEITSNKDVKTSINVLSSEWQKISVYLHDEDRAKLTGDNNARIIIVAPEFGFTPASGSLQIGSFEVVGNSFSLTGDSIYAEEVKHIESGKTMLSEMQRFNKYTDNTVQYFNWNTIGTTKAVSAVKFLQAIPFDAYKILRFYAYVPKKMLSDTYITLSLEAESEFGVEKALEILLKSNSLNRLQEGWHEVTIDLFSNTLHIGNSPVSTSDFSIITLDKTLSPTKLTIDFFGEGSIYIDEIHLSEAIWEFLTENTLDIQWEKSEIIVTENGFPVFTNAKIASNIKTGISTPLESLDAQSEVGMVTDSNAKIDIAGISTEGSIIFSSSNTQAPLTSQNAAFYLQSAAHKIGTTQVFPIFQIINFSEDYRYLPQAYGAKKIEEFGLDFSPLGVHINSTFLTEAEQEHTSYRQEVNIDNNFKFGSDDVFNYTLGTSLFALQNGYVNSGLIGSYGDSWLSISKLQFSPGISDATKRNIGYSLQQELHFHNISLAPSLSFEGKNYYSHTNSTLNTSSDTASLLLPFTVGSNEFLASFKRESFMENIREKGSSYIEDAAYYVENTKQRTWAYTAIPFYDFFDTAIISHMQESLDNAENATIVSYTSEASLEWQRPYFSNVLDFFIPSQASLSASRNIRASTIDSSDIYQISSTVNFISVNNFGRFGTYSIFEWYEQDEILQSLSAQYQHDNISASSQKLEVTGYNQTSLYFSDNEKITLLTEGYIDTNNDWKITINTIWERDGKSSFIVDGFYFLLPQLKEEQQGFTRENTLYSAISKKQQSQDEKGYLQQSYGITHSIELNINKYASLGFDIGGEIFIENNYFNLINNISVSGKLTF